MLDCSVHAAFLVIVCIFCLFVHWLLLCFFVVVFFVFLKIIQFVSNRVKK